MAESVALRLSLSFRNPTGLNKLLLKYGHCRNRYGSFYMALPDLEHVGASTSPDSRGQNLCGRYLSRNFGDVLAGTVASPPLLDLLSDLGEGGSEVAGSTYMGSTSVTVSPGVSQPLVSSG
ncbi:hypothetical protein VNO77_03209 [Canavalia gladiata]|uniref:Uncharacterized protein n=1 Tax=Canavalia gladiata TaxID=3824 RepID=A0AAN9N0S2_CANGL